MNCIGSIDFVLPVPNRQAFRDRGAKSNPAAGHTDNAQFVTIDAAHRFNLFGFLAAGAGYGLLLNFILPNGLTD
jgi:hypothetical protein